MDHPVGTSSKNKPNKYISHKEEDGDTVKVKVQRDENGSKIVNQYLLLRTLGIGSYGKVKLALNHEDKLYYAIKIMKKSILLKRRVGMKRGSAFENAMKEIQLMKKMNHKNIIQLFEVINDPKDDHIFMVIEYAEGGPILKGEPEQFVPIFEEKCKKYFLDVLAALEYLHNLHIIHRDVKPENILITRDGTAKLSDFGVSILVDNIDDEALKKTVGSPAFFAPELCTENGKIVGTALDVWGLGVSLYCCLFARLPFSGETEMQMYDSIRNQEAIFTLPVSPELEDLLKRLLTKDPEKRVTIPEIKIHPWLDGQTNSLSQNQLVSRIN